jgi:hypothetical protein
MPWPRIQTMVGRERCTELGHVDVERPRSPHEVVVELVRGVGGTTMARALPLRRCPAGRLAESSRPWWASGAAGGEEGIAASLDSGAFSSTSTEAASRAASAAQKRGIAASGPTTS